MSTTNGRKPPISSIYTRNSSVSSFRPSTAVSSISTQASTTQPPVRAPIRTAELAPPAPPAITRNGILFLIIDGSPSKQLKSNVQVALAKGRTIAELLIVGEQKDEQALKQFKVEMYGLAGSLKRELGVRVEFVQGVALNEGQLNAFLGSVLGSGNSESVRAGDSDRKELHGVLCDLGENKDESVDILDIEGATLMDRFLRSVGYVHAIARTTIPLLRVAAHRAAAQTPNASEKTLQCPFFVTTLSPLPPKNVSIHDTALRALLNSLSTPGNRGITFGSADVLLAPEPEPIPQENQPAVAPTNGWREQEEYDFTAGESPTKMWSMWSDMQDQLDNI